MDKSYQKQSLHNLPSFKNTFAIAWQQQKVTLVYSHDGCEGSILGICGALKLLKSGIKSVLIRAD
jgi:hypothetical protein